jgi:hypothetical protein
MQEVSAHMTERLTVCGSAAHCQVRLQRFVEAGVNLPIVFPFSPEADYQPSIHRTLTELWPEQ